MSSLVTHIIIPLFILLIFSDELKLSKKMLIFLSFFAIFPDIDIFYMHRFILHNIFIFIIPIAIYYFRKDIKVSLVIAYYLLSHLILDTFYGGIHILYPFSDKILNIMAGIRYYNHIEPIFLITWKNTVSPPLFDMAMVSSENVAEIILLAIIVVVVIWNKQIKYKKLF